MKAYSILVTLVVCTGILVGTTSCFVVLTEDSGKHKGWNKNPHNPHHPNSTNPGHSKGKSKK